MPSRLLREGILDSEAVAVLSFPGEVFYRRLMSVVDDFGRFDARPAVLRSRLYPLQIDKVREADIERWIAECVKSGLIALYSVSGKRYVLFKKLGSPRAKESKFPAPPEDMAEDQTPVPTEITSVNGCTQTQTDESNGERMKASVPYSGSGTSSSAGSSSGRGSSEPAKPPDSKPTTTSLGKPILEFPTVGKDAKPWPLTDAHVAEWRQAFPGVDVSAECRKALAWIDANPAKRKTVRGMPAFLFRWLERCQNRGGSSPGTLPNGNGKPAGETPVERMKRLQTEMNRDRKPQPETA